MLGDGSWGMVPGGRRRFRRLCGWNWLDEKVHVYSASGEKSAESFLSVQVEDCVSNASNF